MSEIVKCLHFKRDRFDDEIHRGSPDLGFKVGWDGFRLRDVISQKRCEIKLSNQFFQRLSIRTKIDDLQRQLAALLSVLYG